MYNDYLKEYPVLFLLYERGQITIAVISGHGDKFFLMIHSAIFLEIFGNEKDCFLRFLRQ